MASNNVVEAPVAHEGNEHARAQIVSEAHAEIYELAEVLIATANKQTSGGGWFVVRGIATRLRELSSVAIGAAGDPDEEHRGAAIAAARAAGVTFDPFTASREEAQAQPDADALHGATYRWAAAQLLLEQWRYYEAHPLEGVAHCAVGRLVAPDWLVRAFMLRINSVVGARSRTWDEAFGSPWPKGTKLDAVRRNRKLPAIVGMCAIERMSSDPALALGKGFWEEIADAVTAKARARGMTDAHIGATRAEDLYREAARRGWVHPSPAAYRPARRLVPKRQRVR